MEERRCEGVHTNEKPWMPAKLDNLMDSFSEEEGNPRRIVNVRIK